MRDEIGAVDADALLLRLFVQEVHVGDQRIGAFGLGDARALGPEFLRVDAELRQERVFLHRLRRQRAVEVVNKGDGFFFWRWQHAFSEPAASAGLGSGRSHGCVVFYGRNRPAPRSGVGCANQRLHPLDHGRLFSPLDL